MSDLDLRAFVAELAAKQGVRLEPNPSRPGRRPPDPPEDVAEIRRMESRLAALNSIPESYRDARFEADQLRKTVDKRAQAKATGLVDAPFVTLHGPSGMGKTPLAVALFASKLNAASWPSGWFKSAAAIVGGCSATEHGEDVRRALSVRMLLLDDVGQEANYEWCSAIVRLIVEERDARKGKLTTIVTTNLTKEAVVQRYGEGCAKRLFRDADIHVGKRGST